MTGEPTGFRHMDGPVPHGFSTDAFLVRPALATDAELDYEAVMASKEFLRVWEQDSWPEDDFTVEDNRADLEKMETRHVAGYAFGYTVMNLDETECLGCVYVMPPDAKMFAGAKPDEQAPWDACDGTVYFWVRTALLESGVDRALLGELRTWFDTAWTLSNVTFNTNEALRQQVELYEAAGMQRRYALTVPGEPARHLGYA